MPGVERRMGAACALVAEPRFASTDDARGREGPAENVDLAESYVPRAKLER